VTSRTGIRSRRESRFGGEARTRLAAPAPWSGTAPRTSQETVQIVRGRQPLPQQRAEPFRAVPTEHALEITARGSEVSATVKQDPLKLFDPRVGGARHGLRFGYAPLNRIRGSTPLLSQLFGLVLVKRTHRRSSLSELFLFRGARSLLGFPLPRKRCLCGRRGRRGGRREVWCGGRALPAFAPLPRLSQLASRPADGRAVDCIAKVARIPLPGGGRGLGARQREALRAAGNVLGATMAGRGRAICRHARRVSP
jgi:hypothetical protein